MPGEINNKTGLKFRYPSRRQTARALLALAAVSGPPSHPGLVLDVTAHQWWWEVQYNATSPNESFTTANECGLEPLFVQGKIKSISDVADFLGEVQIGFDAAAKV